MDQRDGQAARTICFGIGAYANGAPVSNGTGRIYYKEWYLARSPFRQSAG